MKYEYKATVTDVIDGDTVVVTIDLGLDVFLHNQKIRLFGINAPEMNKKEGRQAKNFLLGLLYLRDVRLVTIKDKREKYGRYLAKIYLPDSELSVNVQMINEGQAVPYML